MSRKRFGVVVAHRRFGKTVAAVNALIFAALFGTRHNMRFAYIAPFYGQAKQVAWDYFKQFLHMINGVKFNESELRVDLPNGSRIKLYGGDNADALRGIYLDGVVMDEVADMRPNVWNEVIRPTLTDRLGWALFIGTPKGVNLFYDMFRNAEVDSEWFTCIFRADQTNIIDVRELDSAKKSMTTEQFAQEFLCDFTISDNTVIIPLWLAIEASQRVINDAEVRGGVKVIGVDVAGSTTGRDKTVIQPVQGLKAYPAIVMEGADTVDIVNRLVRETQIFEPDYVRIDMGYGHGVYDMYRSYGFSATGVHFGGTARACGYYANVRAEIWDGTRKWLENGGAIPDDDALIRELSSVRRKQETSSHKMLLEPKKELSFSPDRADALCLAVGVPLMKKSNSNLVNKTQGLKTVKTFQLRARK